LSRIQHRSVAATRRKSRRAFASLLASSLLAIAVVTAIWAITGAGSFWPIWVIFGLSVALIANAWRAFGPQPGDNDKDPDGQRGLD
jgi:uncharacterized membrane protein